MMFGQQSCFSKVMIFNPAFYSGCSWLFCQGWLGVFRVVGALRVAQGYLGLFRVYVQVCLGLFGVGWVFCLGLFECFFGQLCLGLMFRVVSGCLGSFRIILGLFWVVLGCLGFMSWVVSAFSVQDCLWLVGVVQGCLWLLRVVWGFCLGLFGVMMWVVQGAGLQG